jgi:hypothetical protein
MTSIWHFITANHQDILYGGVRGAIAGTVLFGVTFMVLRAVRRS